MLFRIRISKNGIVLLCSLLMLLAGDFSGRSTKSLYKSELNILQGLMYDGNGICKCS